MAGFAVCTIVSKNYLPFARTLTESFLEHNTGQFFLLLVDRIDGFFKPEDERFTLIEIEEIKGLVPYFEKFAFQYSILELNTAIKPYVIHHLFQKCGVEKLIYFDPDILITGSLSRIGDLLDRYSILLTPHLTSPVKDAYRPNEIDILLSGAYNLGFLALSNNATTAALLAWWQDRLYNNCVHAVEKGLFVDQKWMDLVPGMYEGVHVLRDPGYNVAYWNLVTREVTITKDAISVNGEPLCFFHFSGFDPENMERVSKHQNRYKLSMLKDVRSLFTAYRDRLFANGYRECKDWPYFFGHFDNGARIPDLVRKLYLSMGDTVRRFGNPFSVADDSFFSWLNERVDDASPPVTRLMHEIYAIRPDVQKVYPDFLGTQREGFVAWALTSGRREYQLDDRFFEGVAPADIHNSPLVRKIRLLSAINTIRDPLKAILKRLFWRNPGIMNFLQALNRRLNGLLAVRTNSEIRASVNSVENTSEVGINIAGYITSESGTGEAVRGNIRAFEATGIPFLLLNLSTEYRQNDNSYARFGENNLFSVNYIHVNADQVPVFCSQRGDEYFRGKYNIGFWVWELSEFPRQWWPHFRYFNEIWTPSSFCVDALSIVSPVPVIRMPHVVVVNSMRDVNRSYFNLSEDDFIFLFMFDMLSVFERKNPLAVIDAFKRAFAPSEKALLVLKFSNSDRDMLARKKIEEAAQGLRVMIIDRYLDRDELYALMKLSDCYVSLHRSEGFGLTLAESMYLGKPVIATAYSGNMDFMNPLNSFPVRWSMLELDQDYGPYKKGCAWAEPDVSHAAELMRYVYENREMAKQFGERASEEIKTCFSPSRVGSLIQRRMDIIMGARGRDPHRQSP